MAGGDLQDVSLPHQNQGTFDLRRYLRMVAHNDVCQKTQGLPLILGMLASSSSSFPFHGGTLPYETVGRK